ncbi:RHTO0S03e07822g1_1 [Rhodotorula toruloides]|uniref:RING-type E3 ubiquitin transferase n=2 Tax=Rhodotorula toruloides TaxID=5286 RepID=A0A061AMB5_RHOTO|nr:RING finger domain protein [Rhodotorula toruloides NP11]EMS25951.1 RING finger domain protein [Rhodotorula toruloides NP11]CDR38295.1 RHTO0S03e07822g1_1 [Rhodotorula toruloides]
MPRAGDSPPSKRQRTGSLSPHSRRASYSRTSRSPEDTRSRRRDPLEGFDDEAEEPDDARDRRDLSDGERGDEPEDGHSEGEDEEELCAICLSPIENRSVIFPCHHGQFCWQCIRAWTDQSRKCPLCLGPIEHLIHNIRSSKDYQTHYLLPLHAIASTSSAADDLLPPRGARRPAVNPTLPRHALYGRNRYSSAARLNNLDETTWREREEERALERRRFIYREGLYAKHVASNRYTGFKPFTPQTFASNPDLKARVIKFIRRELQVFPAVDVAFLTTYLVSIASQLDLRSAAAIRLISDFLSEQDAQHLVHEIVTFARSPFTSLEGYDRFVQYGRPTREVPKAQELEEMVHDPEELSRQAPRFEEHMRKRRDEEAERERRKPRPIPPMSASLPQRPSEDVRRASQGDAFRDRRGDTGYESRQPSRRLSDRPPSPPPHGRRRSGGYRPRSPSPIREPDWRDRDERYVGSYHLSSSSRRDRPGRGRYAPPLDRRYRGDYRPARSRSQSPSRDRRHRSPSPARRRDRSVSRSRSRSRPPSPARSRRSPSPRRSRSRPPASSRHSRSPSPSRTYASRGRSRSVTPSRPANGRDQETPPPPVDPELRDAISLSVPVLSANPTPRPASPAHNRPPSAKADPAQQQPPQRPMLNIFGAARRILGNGRVVTLSEDGKASLQTHATGRKDGGLAISGRGRNNGKGRAVRPIEQEPYDAAPAHRPASPAAKNLLARLGGIAPSPAPSSTSVASASTAEPSSLQDSLRAKLQARLTAEYRQALASKNNGPSTSSTLGAKGKTDLRSMLQQRLQAEKALAYEDLVRSRASASLAAARAASTTAQTDSLASFGAGLLGGGSDADGQTTYSQATRDLLMARLEEEKLLAADELAGGFALDFGDSYELDYGDYGDTTRALAPEPEQASPPAAEELKQPNKSESTLKAALLAKRQAAVEDELKKKSGELKEKLMRQKLMQARAKAQGGKAANSGTADADTGGGMEGGA